MRKGKLIYILTMTVLTAALVFIIGLRQGLKTELIFGGADGVFVKADEASSVGKVKKQETEPEQGDEKHYDDIAFPDIDITEWRYVLIDSEHIKKNYAPEVTEVTESGVRIDSRIVANFYQMVAAMQEAGFSPTITKGYVSYTDQQRLLNERAAELANERGISFNEAKELAKEFTELPGTSDFQSGLSFMISDEEHYKTGYPEVGSEIEKWLSENAADYGFVRRYPPEKKTVTGRSEPWHYRYVGISTAQFMVQYGICLEELTAHYENQN